ncbi:hypothetical protein C2I17_14720 [Niallia circulans]|uniref:O-antigen ligase family protein n=1 Tax=Niallia circulans TaxID=1397 RepID=UPI00201D3728|nr:O-antigen ligase family protein [Niallia circulans]UQZ75703.1 hypothetical protein C2I17_14720 [Niallia circulans]
MLDKKISIYNITDSLSIFMVAAIPFRAFLTVNGYNVLLLSFFLAYILFLFINGREIKIFPFLIMFSIFFLYCCFSIFYSHYLTGTAWLLKRLIPSFILGFIIAQNILMGKRSNIDKLKFINKLLLGYTIATILVTIYLLIFELPLLEGWGRLGKYLYEEESQMVYSYHLMVSLSFLSYLIIFKKDIKLPKKYTLLIWGSIGLLFIATFLTSIRKAIIAPLLFIAISLFLRDRKKFIKLIKSLLISIILAIVVYVLITKVDSLYIIIGRRIEALINGLFTGEYDAGSYNDLSGSERELLRENAWDLFRQYPIFGYGLDAFKSYTSMHGTRAVYAHSNYLELLASLGLTGFILFYGTMLVLVMKIWFNYRKTNESIYIFGISFILVQLVMDYGQVSYYTITHVLIYFIIASSICIIQDKRKAENEGKKAI